MGAITVASVRFCRSIKVPRALHIAHFITSHQNGPSHFTLPNPSACQEIASGIPRPRN
ncbi:unnamed protein product [Penicillium salamii]|uniref:Uncharacterized protein n=1 Tax=Penicillium salamii TaxID=1612424 RepID=A0A9W4NLG4_9EURO|nr:unnamed protein product [Penicillium salamii]CAG8350653.1 unnamed protein product [Penicillium salamii]CAG8393731.1 unnamed protein product [Penicillium salamii]